MFRRRFLQIVTMAGAAGLAPVESLAHSVETATWMVKGFTCITCATGLDTLLMRQKGVVRSESTYPQGKVTVAFDPTKIDEKAIVGFITDLGFTVAPQSHS